MRILSLFLLGYLKMCVTENISVFPLDLPCCELLCCTRLNTLIITFSPGAVTTENVLLLSTVRKLKLKKEEPFAQVTQPAINPAR